MSSIITYNYTSQSLLVSHWEELTSKFYSLEKINMDSEPEYYIEPTSLGDSIKNTQINVNGVNGLGQSRLYTEEDIIC